MTREECNRLTQIIKLRVVDSSMIGGSEDKRLGEIHNKTFGSGIVYS